MMCDSELSLGAELVTSLILLMVSTGIMRYSIRSVIFHDARAYQYAGPLLLYIHALSLTIPLLCLQ